LGHSNTPRKIRLLRSLIPESRPFVLTGLTQVRTTKRRRVTANHNRELVPRRWTSCSWGGGP